MDRCIFLGNMTRDIEVRKSSTGKSVANFGLAINIGAGENKKTHFFNMVAFDKNADNMALYLHKGDRVLIESEAQQNQWTDQEGNKHNEVNFVVRSWEFAGGKKNNEEEMPFV